MVDMRHGDAASAEPARLQALHAYKVLHTPAEVAFDQIAQLAAQLCGTSKAIISFFDTPRQWVKASVGFEVREAERAAALCEQAMQAGDESLLVPDTLRHPLFATHPGVLDAPYIRFYAGIPLVNGEGFLLGTLAVMDTQARTLAHEQWVALHSLAQQTMAQLESRRQTRALTQLVEDYATMQASLQAQTEKLRLSEERFHLGARATAHAVWDWDFRTQTLWWNEGLEQLVGIRVSDTSHSLDAWAQRIHPDEYAAVTVSWESTIQGSDNIWSSQFRLRCLDGSYIWVQSRGFVIRDDQGKALRMVGGMSDLRAQKQIETNALQEAQLHTEIVEVQQKMASMALDLPQVLALVAEAALRSHQTGGAMVEMLEGERLVSQAAAGPLARPAGLGLAVRDSLVWSQYCSFSIN